MSSVKSEVAPIIFSLFLATVQVATPLLFEIFIKFPALGELGRVSVKFAVNTYKFPLAAVVLEEITETPIPPVALST